MNAQGLTEPGIDGGGVFREFLNELLKTGFDPNHGYFRATQDGLLYPNSQVLLYSHHRHNSISCPPHSPQVHLINEDFVVHYQFLGGMLGKVSL